VVHPARTSKAAQQGANADLLPPRALIVHTPGPIAHELGPMKRVCDAVAGCNIVCVKVGPRALRSN
jgi:hypothetical protein